jgi:hypothetical protein
MAMSNSGDRRHDVVMQQDSSARGDSSAVQQV